MLSEEKFFGAGHDLGSLTVGSRLVGVKRAITDLGPFFGKEWLVWVVAACAVLDGAWAKPKGDAFAVCAASPVTGLALVARGAELVGAIKGDTAACGELESIHVFALMARAALECAGSGVFEQDLAVGCAEAFGAVVAHLVIVASAARIAFEVRYAFLDKKVF